MLVFRHSLPTLTLLAASLRAGASFLGCCDDPPDPPQPPPPQNVTEVNIHIDIPEIAANMQPGDKVVIKTDSSRITADSNLSLEGVEITGHVEVEGGFTTIVLQKLQVLWRKVRVASGLLEGPSTTPSRGRSQGHEDPGAGSGDVPVAVPAPPLPKKLYRHWTSPPIRTVPLSASVVQAIESDPYQTPLRFAFSLPFSTDQELYDSGLDNFGVSIRDASGRSVVPAGARLVSTNESEWPITSRILWDPAAPPVISISLDLLNDDGSIVTPTQLGCDTASRTFTVSMTTADPGAEWDFGWSASLWRTELDLAGTHHGQGGMWLGWHASSFEPVAPINPLPEIVAVTDFAGNPTTSVNLGQIINVVVRDGFPFSNVVEMSVGGRVITTILAISQGGPSETIYTFAVPTTSQTGLWSFFFRNLGATPLMAPAYVPEIQPGYDYVLLDIH
jgi:hypothetical protein